MTNNYGEWLRVELFRLKIKQWEVADIINATTSRTVRNRIRDDKFSDEEKKNINEFLKLKEHERKS